MARRKRAGGRSEHAVPLVFLGVGLLLIAVLLPSALRPPAPQTPQTAQLSPDAPPDNKSESLIASLNRASSGTAGSGTGTGANGTGAGGQQAAGGTTTTVPGPPTGPNTIACPHGFGNPPRQTESVYSAPCALPWHGNNGGATYKNVTASQVQVGFWHILGMPAERGPVPATCTPSMSSQLRTFCYLQKYFNSRYEFYGRYVQLDAAKDDPSDDPSARQAADDQAAAGDFAVVHLSDSFCDELANVQHLVCYDGTPTHVKTQESAAPYWWTYQMNHEENEAMYGEYVCKKLVGRNADYAGAGIQGKPRKIGVIVQDTAVTGFRTPGAIATQIKSQCGYDVGDATVDIRDDDNNQGLATAMLKMQQLGVTTIAIWSDITPITELMQAAQANAYMPEWVMLNSNGADFNTSAKTFPTAESQHMFGMSGWEMPRPFPDSDCYKAYKAMDPSNTPDQTSCTLIYVQLEQIMNGIQLAGPILTPKTFEQGLFKYGHPAPQYSWEIGGGYGPGDRSFVDTYAEFWWDPTAVDPATGEPGGAYRYTDNGRRYGLGQIPRDLNVFHAGDPTGTQ